MGAHAHRASGGRLGKYELLAPLAQGGTSEVFLARVSGEGGFEKVVVVKRLLDHLAGEREFVDMFLDEARIGALLDHSHIVQTLDLGVVEGQHFIAMEYLAGMSLAQLGKKAQQRAGGLPVELTLGLAVQACSGLHYAHERALPDGTPLRLVHRDISPQNLIVTYEGVLKIVDFGIAHATQEARDARTKAGFIKGKFAYMSPEQCLGKPFDRRTDVFALGTVAHELLTGRRLFKRDSTYKTYQAIVNAEITIPSQVNPKLDADIDRVILRALAPRPEDRFATAEELGEALEALLHRRGRHNLTADVARYVERHFQAEMVEHQRMLGELLAGQAPKALKVATVTWHDLNEEVEEIGISELQEISALEELSGGDLVEGSHDDRTSGLRRPPIDDLAAPTIDGKGRLAPVGAPPPAAPAPPPAAPAPPPAPPAAAPAALAPPAAPAALAPPAAPAALAPVRAAPDHDTEPGPIPAMVTAAPEPSRTIGVRPTEARPMWIYPVAFLAAAGVALGLLLLLSRL
jgi:serine/threonine-protein kinase